MAATCGICKTTQSVAHIRAHYAARNGNAVAVLDRPAPPASQQDTVNEWRGVNLLRAQIREHLTLKPSGDRVGYFSINVVDGFGGAPVKFYRVKASGGNGRVYVDVQASDEYHAVRSPQSITMVLKAILVNPKKAAELYAESLGRCYRCGRTLTDETSRSIGMGPECRSK